MYVSIRSFKLQALALPFLSRCFTKGAARITVTVRREAGEE
jgi:hypothetical protein